MPILPGQDRAEIQRDRELTSFQSFGKLARPCSDRSYQPIISPRQCLEHLQDCSGISKPEDRKLLYDAFRKADERLIQDSHTLVWNPGVKSAEVTQAKPVLAPRARPQTASTSVPMGRKTSAGSNPDAGRQSNKTGSNHRRGRTPQSPPPLPTYVPIAAKQLPNRIPTMPAAMRRDNPAPNAPTMQEAMRKSGPHTKDNNRQPPQDSSGPVSTAMSNPEDAGWGVSATSSTYAQHVAAEDSERDELDEPQHDPEDDFTWQAVREKLNNARVLNEQGSVARAQPNDEFFGAEIILEPRGAPSGQSFVPARHVSVPPSRPQSRAAYRGLDGEAGPETSAEGAADTSAEGISYIEPTAVPQLNERAAPIAEPAHAPKTSRRSPSSGDDMNLFRPASPPSTSQPRPDNQAICVSASQREPSYEAQDMPEPELPAEDPWDLVPEPGFESFFPAVGGGAKDSGSFNRPAAQVPLSAKEIETLVARGDTVERKSTRGGNIEQHISRQPSRASSLALSASDMDISDNSDFTAPSERTEKSIQQTAVAAAKPPGGCKSKSQSRKEKKRAKAARRADKKAAAVREELQELEQEQISHLRAQEEQHQGAFVRQGQGQQHVTGHETERVGKNGSQKEFKIDSQRGSPEKTKKTSGQNKAKGKAAPAERSAPRARSPSVECLNPIKAPSQTVKPKSQSQETSVVSDSTGSRHSQARSFDIEGDEDGDIPLRMLHSSPVGVATMVPFYYPS